MLNWTVQKFFRRRPSPGPIVQGEAASEFLSPEKTLCSLRWTYPVINLHRSEVRACCRSKSRIIDGEELKREGINTFLNSAYERSVRRDLLRGVRHDDCSSCWAMEDAGMRGPRTGAETVLPFIQEPAAETHDSAYWRKFVDRVDQNPQWQVSHAPKMLEIMIDNLCDLKCVYCSHHYSSRWAAERIEFGEITPEQMQREFPQPSAQFEKLFWQWAGGDAMNTLEYINFLGGEPLINPKFYQALDRLEAAVPKHEKKRITLAVVTNLNSSEEALRKALDRLEALTSRFWIDFNISNESVGAKAEYIRYGLKYERWLRNLNLVAEATARNHDIMVSLQIANNSMNATSLEDFLRMAKTVCDTHGKPLRLKLNMVNFPDFMSPMILTPEFAEPIQRAADYARSVARDPSVPQNIGQGEWDYFADFAAGIAQSIRQGAGDSRTSQVARRRFYEFIKTNDARRKSDFLSTFPEYAAFYELCAQPQVAPENPSQVETVFASP